MNYLPAWVLEEPVDVTLVHECEQAVYLIQRTDLQKLDGEPPAITLTFGDERILTNGLDIDLGDDMIAVVSLIEDANNHAWPDCYLPLGQTIRSEPDPDSN